MDMIELRIASALALISNVFMKRIRAQTYTAIYSDVTYQGKLMANYVYSLTDSIWFFKQPDRLLPVSDEVSLRAFLSAVPEPSQLLRKTVEAACSMPTTLWFNDPSELSMLIAAGQLTTCHNLMKYVARTGEFDGAGKRFIGPMEELWTLLSDDWTQFNVNPQCFATLAETSSNSTHDTQKDKEA